jgi:hypothetical protein
MWLGLSENFGRKSMLRIYQRYGTVGYKLYVSWA